MNHHSWSFIIGIVLLAANIPVGLAGLGFGAYMAKKTGKKTYYPIGTAIYALSWLMLVAGVWLVGSRGIEMMKAFNTAHPWLKYISPLILIGIITYVLIARSRKHPVSHHGSTPS